MDDLFEPIEDDGVKIEFGGTLDDDSDLSEPIVDVRLHV